MEWPRLGHVQAIRPPEGGSGLTLICKEAYPGFHSQEHSVSLKASSAPGPEKLQELQSSFLIINFPWGGVSATHAKPPDP